MAACKCLGNLGPKSGHFGFPNRFDCRRISQQHSSNNKLFLVDTLALVRRLEAQGVPTERAEAVVSTVAEVSKDNLETVARNYLSIGELQHIQMTLESKFSKFQSEVQSLQGNHLSLLQHETERLKSDIEKMRHELRYEIDKVTAGNRLELNLEKGRNRDELSSQRQETSNLSNKIDREIHALKAQLEGAKYDVIKYCIGTLVSLTAVGLAVVRILM